MMAPIVLFSENFNTFHFNVGTCIESDFYFCESTVLALGRRRYVCYEFFHWLRSCYQSDQSAHKPSPTAYIMMTSSNGNIFRVTGPLCGEFTGHRWIPLTKGSDAELLMFYLTCAWIHGWVNNRDAGDLRRHRTHYDVIVMFCAKCHRNREHHDRVMRVFVHLWVLYQPLLSILIIMSSSYQRRNPKWYEQIMPTNLSITND